MIGNVQIRVFRKKSSYDYKIDPKKKDSWDGASNAQHNMQDIFCLYQGDVEVFRSPCQSVANIPGGRFTDTIVPGKFWIKWGVEKRAFRGTIHGIVGATDMDGQLIDGRSIQPVKGKNGEPIDFARWLVHSTEKHPPAPEGEVCRFAWSAGCFIMTPERLKALAVAGMICGLRAGVCIPTELTEIEG